MRKVYKFSCVIVNVMSAEEKKERSLYGWAFHAGIKIIERLIQLYGGDSERAKKRMETILLNLRSESLSTKFRRELVNIIIELRPDIKGLPRELKEERRWRTEEFYRYSTAILSGFFDAYISEFGSGGE
ncbi:MAG: hypothetical protein DRN04_10655 [Thermoprotei archaeon]|nr:MAG: hypothetical protein DRN04_10655 [Thermoprotei archaeon]